MQRSIFDSNFWMATTIMIIVVSIMGTIILTRYFHYSNEKNMIDKGYQECMLFTKKDSYIMAWQKECPNKDE